MTRQDRKTNGPGPDRRSPAHGAGVEGGAGGWGGVGRGDGRGVVSTVFPLHFPEDVLPQDTPASIILERVRLDGRAVITQDLDSRPSLRVPAAPSPDRSLS